MWTFSRNAAHGSVWAGTLPGWPVGLEVVGRVVVVFSFNANKYGTFPFTGWTTSWYGQVFSDYQIRDALSTTLKVAAEVTVISTIVGTAAAINPKTGARFVRATT